MRNLSAFIVLMSAFSYSAFGAEHVQKTLLKTLNEVANVCDKNSEYYKKTGEECGVKKVRFETLNYSIFEKGDILPYYGTLGYFGFEAKSWADITKYGFVQQIRGCTYETKRNADGTIDKRIGESIMHLGEKRILVFPEWSIDATTNDPLYYGPLEEDSHLPGGRVALYRWTPKLGVTDNKSTKDLYQMLPLSDAKKKNLSPSVFVMDSPSMAYLRDYHAGEEKIYQNVSFEFKICLYNLADIPVSITTDAPMTGVPIACSTWDSQFAYNFEKEKFEHLPNKGLDPFCASQEPLNPAEIFKRESEQK